MSHENDYYTLGDNVGNSKLPKIEFLKCYLKKYAMMCQKYSNENQKCAFHRKTTSFTQKS